MIELIKTNHIEVGTEFATEVGALLNEAFPDGAPNATSTPGTGSPPTTMILGRPARSWQSTSGMRSCKLACLATLSSLLIVEARVSPVVSFDRLTSTCKGGRGSTTDYLRLVMLAESQPIIPPAP
jgi:hypothetical protein